jgi:enoyl-[acyl-carrier protein] reductase I
MLVSDKPYVVMGLLDRNSIAYSIGAALQRLGGKVVYAMQNEVLKRRFLDSDKAMTEAERAALDFRFCDVTHEDQVKALFEGLGPIAGVVHSLAYGNPKTCLGPEFHTDAIADIRKSYEVSCVSLATVARHAVPHMDGGAIVALSFDTTRVYALYNWMGVHKAALEALVRALARRHGRDLVRVNAVSSGPVATVAASKIPEFERIGDIWQRTSPIPWDPVKDKAAVADAVVFLLSAMARKITGQVLAVDGGAALMGGDLQDYERPAK